MREIKFRAWNQDEQEFQHFVFSQGGHWSHNIESYSTNAVQEWQQYTGLKDKNGVEIYEGDVVECVEKEMFNKRKNHVKFTSPVFWDELSWTLRESENCDAALSVYQDGNDKRPITTIKVIGNIYENPELLEPSDV